jgi:pilus assembly protein CpaB
MTDRRLMLVLIGALFVAGAAGYGVFRFLQSAQSRNQVPMAAVVVAATDLPEAHVIAAQEAKLVEMPVTSVPKGAFTSLDSVVGRVTRIPVFTGEALVPGRLAPMGAGAGLEVKIAAGKRAMAVKIDEVAGVSGLIQPNSRVDVLVTLKDESSGTQQKAKLFMSNMRVLSVGSQIERGPDGNPMNATTAALEVTPAEAEELAIAANQGRIQLVLRGYGDPDTVRTDGASTNGMLRRLNLPTQEVARPAPKRKPVVIPTPAPSPPVVTPAAAPVSQKSPDSSVVQVYRRDKLTQQKIARPDSSLLPPH